MLLAGLPADSPWKLLTRDERPVRPYLTREQLRHQLSLLRADAKGATR